MEATQKLSCVSRKGEEIDIFLASDIEIDVELLYIRGSSPTFVFILEEVRHLDSQPRKNQGNTKISF